MNNYNKWFMIGVIFFFIVFVQGVLQDSYLVSYYGFNESTGSALDSIGANAGTIEGSIIREHPSLNANANGSFLFDGSTGYVNITSKPSVCYDFNCTVSVWVNSTDTGTGNFYTEADGTITDNQITFGQGFVAGSRAGLRIEDNTATSMVLQYHNTILQNTEWQQVVYVLNVSSALIYLNGTLVNQTAIIPVMPLNHRITAIGTPSERATADFYDGALDEIGVWDRPLTNIEISDLYNNGNGNFLPLQDFSGFWNTTLTSPKNNTIEHVTDIYFTADVNQTADIIIVKNSTFFVYYSNGTIANQTTNVTTTGISTTTLNITNLLGGDYTWNVEVCGDRTGLESICNISQVNYSVSSGFKVIGEYWKNSTAESSSVLFQLNVSLPAGKVISTADLIYNNTLKAGTIVEIAGDNYSISKTLIVDDITANANLPFHWNITLSSHSDTFQSNIHEQTVSTVSLDICDSNPIKILNYTMRDEGTQAYLKNTGNTGDNATVQLDLRLSTIGTTNEVITFNHTFYALNSTNTAEVCIIGEVINNTHYRVDATAEYTSNGREIEFHHLQNYTLDNSGNPNNIVLYDLLTADSQEFLITFKDGTFNPVPNALIDISRKYVGDGVFRSVEVPKTSPDGTVIGHLVLSDAIYTMTVTKDGVLLGTFNNLVAFCDNQATGDCKINLNAFSSGIEPTSYSVTGNLAYTLSYNSVTRDITSVFQSLDGSTIFMELNATRLDNYFNQSVCTTSLSSSSGTLTCNIPTTFQNVTVLAELFKEGNFVANKVISLKEDASDIFGNSRIIMALILIVTLPLMALTSGVATIIFLMLGVIMAIMLNLVEGSGFLGRGATFLWLAIGGAILIWKISRRE